MIQRRAGMKHVHTLPPGAQVKFIVSSGAMVVAGPDIEPYIVHPDGRTEIIKPQAVGVLIAQDRFFTVEEAPRTFLTAKPGDPAKW